MQKADCAYAHACALVLVLLTAIPLSRDATAAAACPAGVLFASKADGAVLDIGWTGAAHNVPFPGLKLGFALSGCQESGGACGTCSIAAVKTSRGGARRRCADETWLSCAADADCTGAGAAGPCRPFAGPPLPVAGAGFGACVMNALAGPVTGTVNVAAGAIAARIPLNSTLYGGTSDAPCPRCIADSDAQDAASSGRCDGGAREGQPCEIQGSFRVRSFGQTSLDCPPAADAIIGSLARASQPLILTTGAQTAALDTASPPCRASDVLDKKCGCDVCANDATRPCHANSDCSGAVCGSNQGASSAPNGCADGVCTAVDADKGVCRKGPYDARCGPTETFRGCRSDADCLQEGDRCRTALRACYANAGLTGESFEVHGHQGSERGGDPIVGALFCIAPTSNSILNQAFGLPGPGRLTLAGTLTFLDAQAAQ